MNLGPQWSSDAWKKATATEPGFYFDKLYARRDKLHANTRRHKNKPETQRKRWKRKMASQKISTSKKARRAYGPDAVDVSNDVSNDELAKHTESYLQKNIDLTTSQLNHITKSTIQQSESGFWHTERKKRLTASNFGAVVKRNPSLPISKFVHNLLYTKFRGNKNTRNGILQEKSTVEEYILKKAEEKENVVVESVGLVVHPVHKFLAASPDGVVVNASGSDGLIEIKNLVHNKPINLWQAAESKTFCLEKKAGTLCLKKNHPYYFQCQGLLQICNFPWIDFVVRTLNPYQMVIERIERDNDLWENMMLPKLSAFYKRCILPELACPREGKSPGIREPGVWVSIIMYMKVMYHIFIYNTLSNFSPRHID
jgi:hypothetical protein